MSTFTPEQEAQIKLLRKLGIGYRKIATELDLNRDAVRYFCSTVASKPVRENKSR